MRAPVCACVRESVNKGRSCGVGELVVVDKTLTPNQKNTHTHTIFTNVSTLFLFFLSSAGRDRYLSSASEIHALIHSVTFSSASAGYE